MAFNICQIDVMQKVVNAVTQAAKKTLIVTQRHNSRAIMFCSTIPDRGTRKKDNHDWNTQHNIYDSILRMEMTISNTCVVKTIRK